MIFAMIAGSNCYNCQLEDSDYDYFCVYQVPTRSLLSLPEVRPPQVVARDLKLDADLPDITCYEIGKFLEAVQSGSPVIMQSLFCRDHLTYQTDEWRDLKRNAFHFVTAQTVRAYIGYARSEIKQMKGKVKHEYNKFMYHAYRLVLEAERLSQGLPPKIWFETDSEEHKQIMEIRTKLTGSEARNEKLREIQHRLDAVEKVDLSTVFKYDKLKPREDSMESDDPYTLMNNWLIELRVNNL